MGWVDVLVIVIFLIVFAGDIFMLLPSRKKPKNNQLGGAR